jgi:hypothetical protein
MDKKTFFFVNCMVSYHASYIAHPHLLVQVTSEQFLPVEATFIIGLANENH